MQRLRIRFGRGEEVKFISHLDIMRLWQRVLHRAGMPPAYSEGFSPHPRISLAAPLPLGVTSQAELMDIFCHGWVSAHSFTSAVSQQLPEGIEIFQVYQVDLNLPSLQSQVQFAEYSVGVAAEKNRQDVESALVAMLSLDHLPWQHQRDTGPRRYDLRDLIDNLWLIGWQEEQCEIGMKLRCGSSGSGRPEQVTLALGLASYPQSIHRTRLILKTN